MGHSSRTLQKPLQAQVALFQSFRVLHSHVAVMPGLPLVAGLLLARGVEGAEIAVSMFALAVCVTLLLQATTAGYLARRRDGIKADKGEEDRGCGHADASGPEGRERREILT